MRTNACRCTFWPLNFSSKLMTSYLKMNFLSSVKLFEYAVLVQIRSLTRSRDGYECRLIFSRSNFLSEIYDQVTSYPEIQSVRNSDFGPFRTIIVRVLLKDQNRNTHSFMITWLIIKIIFTCYIQLLVQLQIVQKCDKLLTSQTSDGKGCLRILRIPRILWIWRLCLLQ